MPGHLVGDLATELSRRYVEYGPIEPGLGSGAVGYKVARLVGLRLCSHRHASNIQVFDDHGAVLASQIGR